MNARSLMFLALVIAAQLVIAAEPATPGSPAIPATPSTPAMPAIPATPSTPAMPAIPAEPATSATAENAPSSAATFDVDLVRRTGADERGMRKYVLVILKTGPNPVPKGPDRDAMFAGHFANIGRLVKEGKLALAGPFSQDASGWRGLYIFAVDDIDAARALTETDPVIIKGEMVAEYHDWYGSAAAMLIPEWHERLVPPAAAPAETPVSTTPPK